MLEQVQIRRAPQAKRWRLRADWGEPATLTIPPWMSEREIAAVIGAHQGWVERQRARQVPQLDLEQRGISEPEGRRLARSLISPLAAAEASVLGVSFGRITIRDQRTRWGSCSARGTLSFNWRLALAPPEVLDYVVVHEVCHLREANHSARFWRLVAERRPQWPEQRAWLRRHGTELLAFRPGRGR